jgi:hypothetical protein
MFRNGEFLKTLHCMVYSSQTGINKVPCKMLR